MAGSRAIQFSVPGPARPALGLALHRCCLPVDRSGSPPPCCCPAARSDSQPRIPGMPPDEVDAPSRSRTSSTTHLVDIAFKLAFLKILLVDIGISLGDNVTDFLQGFNLILNFSTWTVRWASLEYGLAILLASWLPLPIALLHLGFSEEDGILPYLRSLPSLLLLLVAGLLFPCLPTLGYLLLLVSPRGSPAQRRQYKARERRAHELKSISGAVEAPVQLVLLLYLMLRGVLTLPWAEPLSSSCVEDSLGRVACLPSLPMASITFSALSIVKAVFDLNIYPLVREYETCCNTYKLSLHLLFRFTPFFLANAIFRICTFALIIVYLDWWSIIPFSILLLLNLVVFGLSFRRFAPSPSPACSDPALSAAELHRLSTVEMSEPRLEHGASVTSLPGTPPPEDRRRALVGWLPPADLQPPPAARPFRLDPVGWNQNMVVLSPPTPLEDPQALDTTDTKRYSLLSRMSSMVSSEHTVTPFFINEENTSVFLNALTGMFFPCCHTHLEPLGPQMQQSDPGTFRDRNEERLEGLLAWQGQVYRRQVYGFNTILMLIIIVVLVLVSGVPSFNYRDNILSSFWFSLTCCFLLLSGLLSLLLTHQLDRPCLPARPKDPAAGAEAARPRDRLGRRGLCLQAASCLALCLLVCLPGLAGLAVLGSMEEQSPYLLLVRGPGPAGATVSLSILSGLAIRSPGPDAGLATTSGPLSTDCTFPVRSYSRSLEGAVLLVNSSRPACRALLARKEFVPAAEEAGCRAVVVLDDTPPARWRVSSPLSAASLPAALSPGPGHMAVLLVREADWRGADSLLKEMARERAPAFLAWNDPSQVSLQPLFSCGPAGTVRAEGPAGRAERCAGGKVLHRNGSLQEEVCVRGSCSILGRDCPFPWARALRAFSLQLSCSHLTGTDLTVVGSDARPLPAASLPLPSSAPSSYCCSNSTSSSSFLRVLGPSCFSSWRGVAASLAQCQWSPWVAGSCQMEEREQYRLCIPAPRSPCIVREHRTLNCNTGDQLAKCRGSLATCT